MHIALLTPISKGIHNNNVYVTRVDLTWHNKNKTPLAVAEFSASYHYIFYGTIVNLVYVASPQLSVYLLPSSNR